MKFDWVDDLFDGQSDAELQELKTEIWYKINTTTYTDEYKAQIKDKINSLKLSQLIKLKDNIENDQLCPIRSGHNYQQGDIVKKFKKEI